MEFRLGDLSGVGLEDPGLRLHDLTERPVRGALSVRQRAPLAPCDELLVGVDDAAELVEKPALPHPGHADERHELRRAIASRPLECVHEEVELAIPPNEGCAARSAEIHAEPRSGLDSLPHVDGLRLALRLDRVRIAVHDLALGGPNVCSPTRIPSIGAADWMRARGVDHIARHHRLALARSLRRARRALRPCSRRRGREDRGRAPRRSSARQRPATARAARTARSGSSS